MRQAALARPRADTPTVLVTCVVFAGMLTGLAGLKVLEWASRRWPPL